MKQLRSGVTSLLIGDDAAELLVEYAVAVGREQSAASIELSALRPSGATLRVTFLVNNAFPLVVETTDTGLQEPENGNAESYLRSQITAIEKAKHPSVDDIIGVEFFDTP